jgi:alpha-amylase
MSNGVIYQPFAWYDHPDPPLWETLAHDAPSLSAKGYTAVWLPPPCKGSGGIDDQGYGVYDLFDLGEFPDADLGTRTKYGTKAQLIAAVRVLQQAGLQVYVDSVFNHKDGGDETETFLAQLVDRNDRNMALGDWFDIKGWTHFNFPARGNTHSSMKWHWWHFDALSYNQNFPDRKDDIYRIKNKSFETAVSGEFGNYDYLMACDLESSNAEVDGELRWWGRWIVDTLGVDGFRIDAVKHIRRRYFCEWLNHLRTHFGGRELFAVGEYWSGDVNELHRYLDATENTLSVFDVPLHYNFFAASHAGRDYDLRRIFDYTLVAQRSTKAVTFVDNHDTEPTRSLTSFVEPWFKPLAYALILLRRDGYPCVFAGDLREWTYPDGAHAHDHRFMIETFLRARRDYGFGDQYDYLDHPNTIGWTRLGDAQHPGAMAVVLGNGTDGDKWMEVRRANATFTDATGHFTHKVTTNGEGWGNFPCRGGKVSVWLQE